jgi:pimeloyl-ACP methyl ester carboxylesterase
MELPAMSIIVLCSRRFAFVAFLLVCMGSGAVAEDMLEISPRSGVSLRMLIWSPEDIKAVALLLPGGHGRVKVQNDGSIRGLEGNFLVRMRSRFQEKGIATAVFDAPSDHSGKEGLTYEYRMTNEHASDIGMALAALRERFKDKPVWLIGTSRGSTSAANAATNLKSGNADGLVLTSSVGISTKKGGNVRDFDLADITMPVLVMHHAEDNCNTTPLRGAKGIFDDLKKASRKELVILEGGEAGQNPCQGASFHGFQGIEDKAVDVITQWVTKG